MKGSKIAFLTCFLFAIPFFSSASVLQGFQGGTGFGATSSAAIGQFLQVSAVSPFLTYTFASAGSSGVQALPTSTAWIDSQVLFGILGGGASSSQLFTVSTSTGVFTIGSSSIANQSSTNITSGALQVTGQSSLASVSSTNQYLVGYLFVKGGTNQTQNLLTITSSTNQQFFTISAMGIVSSSEMRVASLTATAFEDSSLISGDCVQGGVLGALGSTPGPCISGTVNDSQFLFGTVGNTATSTAYVTFATSTGVFTVSASSSLVNVSSSGNITATGYVSAQTLLQGSTGVVLTTRTVSTNAPLGGGGALSANLTLTCTTCLVVQATPSSTSWNAGNILFGQLDGTATTSLLFSLSTTTGQLTVGSTSISNVSGTPRIDAGRITFTTASSTDNVYLGGLNNQIANQLTFSSASGSYLYLSGYVIAGQVSSTGNISGVNLQATTHSSLGTASSTNLDTGYLVATGQISGANVSSTGGITAARGQFTTRFDVVSASASTNFYVGTGLTFSAASGTTLDVPNAGHIRVQNLYDYNGTKFTTSTSSGVQSLPSSTVWVDQDLLFGELNGQATTSLLFSVSTSTGQLTVSSSSLASVSSTNITASGYLSSAKIIDTGLTAGTLCVKSVNGLLTSASADCAAPTPLSTGVDGQILQGVIGGSASSTLLIQVNSSTIGLGGVSASTTALLFLQNTIANTATDTFMIQGMTGQSGDLFDIDGPNGSGLTYNYFTINSVGQISVGSSTINSSGTIFQVATTTMIFSISSQSGFVGIQTDRPSSTLHLVGDLNQSANFLTVQSSTGQIFFTISPMGLASSSQFRAASGTINALTVTSCTGCGSGLTTGQDGQMIQGVLGGNGSSTLIIQVNSSTIALGGKTASTTALVFLQSTIISTASGTLLIQGSDGQFGNLLDINSSTGQGNTSDLFTVNSTGQVLIATSTTPASSTLFYIATSSPAFIVDKSGNVGIGTSTPSKRFSIGTSTEQFSVNLTSGQTYTLQVNASNTKSDAFDIVRATGAASTSILQIGGGTKINIVTCYATSTKFAALASNATTSIKFTGVTVATATPQTMWFGGFQTSTSFFLDIAILSVIPSSTPKSVDVEVQKLGTGTFAATGLVTSTLCTMDFR